jgi:hypothetical protein
MRQRRIEPDGNLIDQLNPNDSGSPMNHAHSDDEITSLMHREDVAKTLASGKSLVDWIATRQHGLQVKSDGHARISASLLDLTIEHHAGIVLLVNSFVYASAFALVRVMFESFVRAVWLQLCATPQQLETLIEKDTFDLHIGDMIDEIEKHEHFQDKVLSKLKKNAWKAMNGYTHGGLHQIARRMKSGNIQPNYESEEVIEVLKMSGFLSLMATLQIALLAENVDLEKEVNAKLHG